MTPQLHATLVTFPGRCQSCAWHVPTQGHSPSCDPRALASAGMSATTSAHPDDAARVDEVLARFIRSGRPFSANDARPMLAGVKGSVVGARWGAASRRKQIVRTGDRVPSTDPATHGHLIDIWKAAA